MKKLAALALVLALAACDDAAVIAPPASTVATDAPAPLRDRDIDECPRADKTPCK